MEDSDKIHVSFELMHLQDEETLLCGSASERHWKKLAEHRQELVDSLEKCDDEKFFNMLQQNQVLTDSLRMNLDEELWKTNKMKNLLNVIPTRGSGGFMYFCEVLQNMGLEHIANKLLAGEDAKLWKKYKEEQKSLQVSKMDSDEEDSLDSDVLDDPEDLPVNDTWMEEMRAYQLELAEPALEKKSYIVCAPTNSGKTWVAAYIIKHHLENCTSGPAKVVFFARTVCLVRQQYRLLKSMLSEYSVDWLTSANSQRQLRADELIDANDVVCMTPAILDIALDEKRSDLSKITLLLLDECHHTLAAKPYNKVMGKYVDQKISLQNQLHFLPQVVGFTATLGVGKAQTQTEANNHVMALCANVDASLIKTVTRNVDELGEYVSTPVECIENIPSRKEGDPFSKIIVEIMKTIEEVVKTQTDQDHVGFKELYFPESRHSLMYSSAIRTVWWRLNFMTHITGDVKADIISCLEHLYIYSKALSMHREVRAEDAVRLLENNFKTSAEQVPNNREKWLINLYESHLPRLRSESSESSNPKLEKLRDIILDAYREKPEMYSLLFTTTREGSRALKLWMEDDSDLKLLNPDRMTGLKSMSSGKQESILDHFKNGDHKILIVTKVAEEGLDVKACNAIFRYNYKTSEVGRIQTKGRARLAGGFIKDIISDDHPQLLQSQTMNLHREGLMKHAVHRSTTMAPSLFRNLVQSLQKEASRERQHILRQRALFNSLKSEASHPALCQKCEVRICSSSDIVRFGKHHICIGENIERIIGVVAVERTKKFDDFYCNKKFHCKKCGHKWGCIFRVKGTVNVPILKPDAVKFVQGSGSSKKFLLAKIWPKVKIQFQEVDIETLKSRFRDWQPEVQI